jgi:hypothetical protein
MPDQFTISVDQLRIGLYVYIDVKWFEHPFAFNNFKIKSEDQITTIRGLGLQSVRYDPERSDVRPPAKVVGPAEPRQTPAAFIESRPKATAPSEAPPQPAAAAEPQSQQARRMLRSQSQRCRSSRRNPRHHPSRGSSFLPPCRPSVS